MPPPLTGSAQAESAGSFIIGHSVQGRSIMARRFGDGEKVVLLVGGTHGGWEANTVALIDKLIAHFEQNPDDVLSGVSLILIPTLNPDGMIYGMEAAGRFNANGVDLNRNWGCGWQSEAYWRDQRVSAGERPFSEPETQALSDYILMLEPSAVLFYHSMAGGVFAGECYGDHGSAALAAVVGEAAGYSYGQAFSAYPVTGTAPSWVDGQGIPAVDIELETREDSEFEANLRGVMAVQRAVTSNE